MGGGCVCVCVRVGVVANDYYRSGGWSLHTLCEGE